MPLFYCWRQPTTKPCKWRSVSVSNRKIRVWPIESGQRIVVPLVEYNWVARTSPSQWTSKINLELVDRKRSKPKSNELAQWMMIVEGFEARLRRSRSSTHKHTQQIMENRRQCVARKTKMCRAAYWHNMHECSICSAQAEQILRWSRNSNSFCLVAHGHCRIDDAVVRNRISFPYAFWLIFRLWHSFA